MTRKSVFTTLLWSHAPSCESLILSFITESDTPVANCHSPAKRRNSLKYNHHS